MIAVDLTKSLEQLDGQDWGPPNFGSYVVTSCHRLRKKPLCDFEGEDFRVLLGQSVSLEFLIPASLAFLQKNPLAGGHFHPGSVLEHLLRSDAKFRMTNPDLRAEITRVVTLALSRIESLEEDDQAIAQKGISSEYEAFQKRA